MHAYNLPQKTHKKNHQVDLSTSKLISETVEDWFIKNCSKTILQDEWYEGRLNKLVGDVSYYEEAITNCMRKDMKRFQERGLLQQPIEYLGQIKNL